MFDIDKALDTPMACQFDSVIFLSGILMYICIRGQRYIIDLMYMGGCKYILIAPTYRFTMLNISNSWRFDIVD